MSLKPGIVLQYQLMLNTGMELKRIVIKVPGAKIHLMNGVNQEEKYDKLK